jgi:hypothetical protein
MVFAPKINVRVAKYMHQIKLFSATKFILNFVFSLANLKNGLFKQLWGLLQLLS